ncbi:MAG: DNA methyltransferase [Nitrospirota bacterium]|nr:DNA methyltransferase [Nitrospirota bacterium]
MEKLNQEIMFARESLCGNASNGASWHIHHGDALKVLKTLPSEYFHCVVTSPPYYWLRDYDVEGQIGHEENITDYLNAIAAVMDEIYRVLRKNGLVFLNLGDTYYSGKGKSHGDDPKSTKRRFGLRAVDKSGGLGIGLRPKSMIGIPWRVAIEIANRKWVLRSASVAGFGGGEPWASTRFGNIAKNN